MRTALLFAASLFAVTACKGRDEPAETPPPPPDSLTVVDSFQTPESVVYDRVMDAYAVSNINGSPFDRDDNGFISRLAPDGRVVELRWIDGASDSVRLNAPKGLAIRGDTLYVADIDSVRLFDRTTGSTIGAWGVPGASFLNDVAVGPDGTVYVTDTGLDQQFVARNGGIYQFDATGRSRLLVRMRGNGPNGIVADSGGLYVVSWNGEFAHVTPRGEVHSLPRPAHPQLDGLIRLPNGALVASVWHDSSLVRLNPGDSAWTTIATGVLSPADIGYDTRRGRVLIPIFQGNRIEVRPLR